MKMMELLGREVPIRCQDVSIYFSLEEWDYIEGHKDQYQDIVMMEDHQTLTPLDGSNQRKPPPECSILEEFQDCPGDPEYNVSPDHQKSSGGASSSQGNPSSETEDGASHSSLFKMESKMNRTPLTCPICLKTDNFLATHLRRRCMRGSNDEDIKATLAKARQNLFNVASNGLAINYREIASLLCGSQCVENMCTFLKKRGFLISNVPAVRGKSQLDSWLCGKEVRIPQKHIQDMGTVSEIPRDPPHYQQRSNLEEPAQTMGAEKKVIMISDLESEEEIEQPQTDTEEESVEEEEAMETETDEPSITWKNPLRKKMSKAGMYKRHPLDKQPISGFADHLSKTLGVVRYKQEVENVARFLYYMDNKKPSLKFIYDIQKTNEYFTKLLEIGNTNQNVFNYLKNLKRFLTYLMDGGDQALKDKETHYAACLYMSQLEIFQKRLSKGITEEKMSKDKRLAKVKSPSDLVAILTVAEAAFKSAVRKADRGDELTTNEKLTILNYLECLITLRKLQRRGVVHNMTVDEWKKRIPQGGTHVAITVHEHQTVPNRYAVLVLTTEEEKWFETYFTRVRPTFLQGKKKITNFFISSSGEKIYNVSNDISRFHHKFGLKAVTSQLARNAAETFVSSKSKESGENSIFAQHLRLSNRRVEHLHREKIMDDFRRTLEMQTVYQETEEQPTTSKSDVSDQSISKVQEKMAVPLSKVEQFENFLEKYPLSVGKEPPTQKICLAQSAVHGQHIYDRWRKLQNSMRVQHIIGLLQEHQPREEEVRRCIAIQLWKNNLPRIKDILELWKKQ
ncbi:uncharacterized protein [Engystomops pustulosus]